MFGQLAFQIGEELEIRVLESQRGFYIGTCDDMGPVSRESVEYWRQERDAKQALEDNTWTQRPNCFS